VGWYASRTPCFQGNTANRHIQMSRPPPSRPKSPNQQVLFNLSIYAIVRSLPVN
jgi:hypothetical protein